MPERASVPELVDFSLSYGECAGYCTTVLQVSGTELELVRRSDDEADPELRFRGMAKAQLANRIRQATATTAPADLEPLYGSPDSHDEGVATVRLLHHGVVTEHSYSATAPPQELQALHDLLSSIAIAWIECEEMDGVTFHDCP
jgi:hypothetical protein